MSAISGKAEDDHATTTDQTDNGGQNVQVDSALPVFPPLIALLLALTTARAICTIKAAPCYVQVGQ